MSLFSASLPIPALVKRDVPHLEERLPEFHIQEISDEMVKRQVPGLPSLSGGIPGVGIGSLPLSGIPGKSTLVLALLIGANTFHRRISRPRLPCRFHREEHRRPRRLRWPGLRDRPDHGSAQRRHPQLRLQAPRRSRQRRHFRRPPAPVQHQPDQVQGPGRPELATCGPAGRFPAPGC
jgi:hypothetical protein